MNSGKVYDAESVEVTIGGKPMREWRPTDEQRGRRHLPNVEFKMALPVEPGATRMLLRELRRRDRNKRKSERRKRKASK